jgi:hypothetical protein
MTNHFGYKVFAFENYTYFIEKVIELIVKHYWGIKVFEALLSFVVKIMFLLSLLFRAILVYDLFYEQIFTFGPNIEY